MKRCQSILVVDDNNSVRMNITEALRMEGYSVLSAANGLEAIAALHLLSEPVLIFLDLMMPEMTGWEFLEKLTAEIEAKGHQVVTISAVPAIRGFDDPRPLKTAGALKKPFSLSDVFEWVEKLSVPLSTQQSTAI